MEIQYRQINFKSFISFLVLWLICVFFVSQAQAYDDLFTVDGVTVDVTAENGVAARDQAFAKAQVDAFTILSQRMVEDAQGKQVSAPDAMTISTMILDFEVTNEQVSNTRYIGTYTFRFDEAAVSKFFSVSGVKFASQSSPPLLVLPFFQENDQIGLWSESNLWLSAWAGADLKRGVVPVVVPIGDLMDVGDVDDSRALSPDPQGLTRILGRYEASDAALMIAVPDVALASVAAPDEVAKGNLRVSLYSIDNGQPLKIQDFDFKADGKQTREQLYTQGVQAIYATLQKDWKAGAASVIPADTRPYIVSAEFSNLGEWVKIQKSLKGIRGVSGVTVGSLKQNSARVAFSFAGDENYLRQTLAQNNLDLGEAFENVYPLRYAAYQGAVETLPDGAAVQEVQPTADEARQPEVENGFYRPPVDPSTQVTTPDTALPPTSPDEELPAPPMEDVMETVPEAGSENPNAIDMNSQEPSKEFGIKTF